MKQNLLCLVLLLGTYMAQAQVFFDFETPATSTGFTYFGSSLEPGVAPVIANPAPDAENNSANVCHYTKAANSQTWAGAFCAPAQTINATNGGQICMDVHMDHIGVVGLKLEGSPTGADWIITVPNTKVNEWERLCFDLSANGIEPLNSPPAIGHVYNQLVIFPDFDVAFPADQNYYLDNFEFEAGMVTNVDVTFSVDMNQVTTSFTTVYVSGTMNGWSGDANPMSDPDGDGIWTTTLNLPTGTYEYKFSLDNWANSEQFDGTDVCTITTVDGANVFTNRKATITANSTLAFCYESCYACDNSIDITWNVNMNNETVATEGVFLAGGPFFGHGDFPMTDPDGDGVYSITLERQKGFASDYTFINGICLPDWNCKEDIAGQSCAVAPFNDRNLVAGNDNVVINTCFGECSTDGTCSGTGVVKYNATFNVDMRDETVGANVWLAGSLNGWSVGANEMLDPDGDGVYTVTVELPVGIVEYKFVNDSEFELLTPDDCTITDPSGQFTNRLLLMDAMDIETPDYLFGSCSFTSSTNDVFDASLFNIRPTLVNDILTIEANTASAKYVEIYAIDGRLVHSATLGQGQTTTSLSVGHFNKGMYFVKMVSAGKFGTQKFMKQ